MIGGCHQDVLGRAGVVYEPATSCPGIVSRRPGGVARNVAVLLGRAGAPCRFVSVVGDDADNVRRRLRPVHEIVHLTVEARASSSQPPAA